jgi:hypothetical protein
MKIEIICGNTNLSQKIEDKLMDHQIEVPFCPGLGWYIWLEDFDCFDFSSDELEELQNETLVISGIYMCSNFLKIYIDNVMGKYE